MMKGTLTFLYLFILFLCNGISGSRIPGWGRMKFRNVHAQTLTKSVPIRGLPTKLLNRLSDIEHRKTTQLFSALPSIIRDKPAFLNSVLIAWILASSYSLLSIVGHFKEHPGDDYNEIFEIDNTELTRCVKQSFPFAPPLRKIIGVVVPILRVCQFVECVLYPEDDNGESWTKLVKSWRNNKARS
jgi:hypothetical protein